MSALLAPAKIKVIVVPVHPVATELFEKYLDILNTLTHINLSELNPPDANVKSKFSHDLYHDGDLYFQFTKSYDKDLAPLEEIVLSRQIFAVKYIILIKGYWYYGLPPMQLSRRLNEDISKYLTKIPRLSSLQMLCV
jgi:hypothetical protein